MSREKAIDRLRWYLKNEEADCPTYEDMQEIYEELLESEPEPTEFTKEFRSLLRRGNGAGDSTFEAVYEMSYKTCDCIDRLTAENKQLKCEIDRLNSTEFITFAKTRIKKIKQLQAELKAKGALLKAAKCPNCNGDGAYYDSYGNVCQCQWCYEVEQALKGNSTDGKDGI